MKSKNVKKSYFSLLLFLIITHISAQQITEEQSPPQYIKTIQLYGNGEFSGTPILEQGARLTLKFDDIHGDEANYYYKITHYNFDWTPSQLYKNEYIEGFDDVRILTYENSFNTLQIYSHYTLNVPNEDTRALKVSGNYMISIYNDDDELVFSRKFIICEKAATVGVAIKRSRNFKFINTKQAVQFEVNPSQEILRDPMRTVRTVVIQNNDLKRAITNLKPQYTIGKKLVYRYDTEASFWGCNEYLHFDNKEVRASTANIRRIDLKNIYHNYLYTDIVRTNRNYTYFPDINGNFVVRKLDAEDSNVEADYVWMHFSLESYEALDDGEIHLFGGFNNYAINQSTKLTYDDIRNVYTIDKLFKQGFNNYKYILVKPDGSIHPGFFSGNFDETENEYTVIPYYRAPGARYDRAIGKGSANSRNITN